MSLLSKIAELPETQFAMYTIPETGWQYRVYGIPGDPEEQMRATEHATPPAEQLDDAFWRIMWGCWQLQSRMILLERGPLKWCQAIQANRNTIRLWPNQRVGPFQPRNGPGPYDLVHKRYPSDNGVSIWEPDILAIRHAPKKGPAETLWMAKDIHALPFWMTEQRDPATGRRTEMVNVMYGPYRIYQAEYMNARKFMRQWGLPMQDMTEWGTLIESPVAQHRVEEPQALPGRVLQLRRTFRDQEFPDPENDRQLENDE